MKQEQQEHEDTPPQQTTKPTQKRRIASYLRESIRRATARFNFDTLIRGVSRQEKPAPAPVEPVAPSGQERHAPTPTRPRPVAHRLCPICQEPATIYVQSCAKCGHAFEAAPDLPVYIPQVIAHPTASFIAPLDASPPPVTPTLVCSNCGNSDVRKVSAVYEEAASSLSVDVSAEQEKAGTGRSADAIGVTGSYTGRATGLAQALAPPAKPIYDEPVCRKGRVLLYISVCLVGLTLLSLASVLVSPMMAGGFVLLITALLCVCSVGFLWMTAERSRREKAAIREAEWKQQQRLERWERAVSLWETLLYCPHCHRVYDPRTGRSVRAGEMRSLLQ